MKSVCMVASTIITHVTGTWKPSSVGVQQGSFHRAVASEDNERWRRALDKKYVVGVMFVDFRKAFDAIPHSILIRKLQSWCSW